MSFQRHPLVVWGIALGACVGFFVLLLGAQQLLATPDVSPAQAGQMQICVAPGRLATSLQDVPGASPASPAEISIDAYLTEQRVSRFSGQTVPRFASVGVGQANVRKGPGLDHRVELTFQCPGLPVLVIAESESWRRIVSPWGQQGWIMEALLDTKLTALTVRPGKMFARPTLEADVIASLNRGMLAGIAECAGSWCQVKVGEHDGWISRDDLWGARELANSSP